MELETNRMLSHVSLYNRYKLFIALILMSIKCEIDWVNQPRINKILLAFSTPKTPKQVENELCLNKLKVKPFLEKQLIRPLNPEARKGRYYSLTQRARKALKMPEQHIENQIDWDLTGWILASPKQKLIVLKSMDSVKRTSEDIRKRAYRYNPNLTRISTKTILNDLRCKGLIKTKIDNRNRYYWLNSKGQLVYNQICKEM